MAHFNYYFRRSIYPADEMFLAPDADTGGTKTGEDIDQPPGFQGASLLGSWRESLLPPDTFSYTHLMTALEKLGRERACLSAIHEMRARGVKVRLTLWCVKAKRNTIVRFTLLVDCVGDLNVGV